MPHGAKRTARIAVRIAPDTLCILKHAAELQRRTVSEFVIAAAQEVALRIIADAGVICLTAQEQRRFVQLLLKPPAHPSALERAKSAHARLIRR